MRELKPLWHRWDAIVMFALVLEIHGFKVFQTRRRRNRALPEFQSIPPTHISYRKIVVIPKVEIIPFHMMA